VRLAPFLLALAAAPGAWAKQATVTVLATTDLHGNLYPADYYTDKPVNRGLAKVASLIAAERRDNADTLLIDCGDTIEGSPMETVYQHFVESGRWPLGLTPTAPLEHDPMMLAMNALGYRAMTLGNHEFNFGLKNLERARRDARFPWISANTEGDPAFAPYVVETVGGVKVAVIGVTTPAIPTWEMPEHYRGYRFLDPRKAVASAVAALREKERPQVIVVAAHMGLGPDSGENQVLDIARDVPGIDAIVFGHTHRETNERAGGVLLVQPKNWGASLAQIDFVLEDGKLTDKRARLIPVTDAAAADPEMLGIGKPYHEITERYLGAPVTESAAALSGALGRVEDSALVDAIQRVQLFYTKADVSFASLFNPRVSVPKGPVTVRQIAALYLYDNELYAIEGTGAMVKEALENAARFFQTCPDPACSHGPLINSDVIGYNYDMAEGVEYEIDLRQPAGQRVVNLRRNGRPLAPGEKLRIALNSYRAGGSAGYTMFRGAKVLWKSAEDIRSLMIEYYSREGKLPAEPDGNWRIVPRQAVEVLEREAQ
jgi:2',3'-cyclic-nucleotide 2'-phosphodiesterase/3'-nucleotidase